MTIETIFQHNDSEIPLSEQLEAIKTRTKNLSGIELGIVDSAIEHAQFMVHTDFFEHAYETQETPQEPKEEFIYQMLITTWNKVEAITLIQAPLSSDCAECLRQLFQLALGIVHNYQDMIKTLK